MSSLYTEAIRRWAADDRRAGTLLDAHGTGEVGLGASEAGRRLAVRFTMRLHDHRIEAIRYQVFGCGFTIAACAAAAHLVEGQSLSWAERITPAWVDAALGGLPEERAYCAELAVEALQAAFRSAGAGHAAVTATLTADADHGPLVKSNDPTYRLLIDSPAPPGTADEDRELFAGLIAVAARESTAIAANSGLTADELAALLDLYFPAVSMNALLDTATPSSIAPPHAVPEIDALLLGYLLVDNDGWTPVPSLWLARSLAARAARTGHLWRAMGLRSRPQLTSAIQRHLPALAAANNRGMRWKRFFYKTLCERSGGTMCRTPNCGECSEYAVCFDV